MITTGQVPNNILNTIGANEDNINSKVQQGLQQAAQNIKTEAIFKEHVQKVQTNRKITLKEAYKITLDEYKNRGWTIEGKEELFSSSPSPTQSTSKTGETKPETKERSFMSKYFAPAGSFGIVGGSLLKGVSGIAEGVGKVGDSLPVVGKGFDKLEEIGAKGVEAGRGLQKASLEFAGVDPESTFGKVNTFTSDAGTFVIGGAAAATRAGAGFLSNISKGASVSKELGKVLPKLAALSAAEQSATTQEITPVGVGLGIVANTLGLTGVKAVKNMYSSYVKEPVDKIATVLNLGGTKTRPVSIAKQKDIIQDSASMIITKLAQTTPDIMEVSKYPNAIKQTLKQTAKGDGTNTFAALYDTATDVLFDLNSQITKLKNVGTNIPVSIKGGADEIYTKITSDKYSKFLEGSDDVLNLLRQAEGDTADLNTLLKIKSGIVDLKATYLNKSNIKTIDKTMSDFFIKYNDYLTTKIDDTLKNVGDTEVRQIYKKMNSIIQFKNALEDKALKVYGERGLLQGAGELFGNYSAAVQWLGGNFSQALQSLGGKQVVKILNNAEGKIVSGMQQFLKKNNEIFDSIPSFTDDYLKELERKGILQKLAKEINKSIDETKNILKLNPGNSNTTYGQGYKSSTESILGPKGITTRETLIPDTTKKLPYGNTGKIGQ